MDEERKVIALLSVGNEQAFKEHDGIIDHVEFEFGWLGNSGIALDEALIIDNDDEDDYARYLTYLANFIFARLGEEGCPSPLSFEEFLKAEPNLIEY